MGIEVKCSWCGKPKELEHMGRYNDSGHHFCDQICQNNYRRGFPIDVELKKEILSFREEGWAVKEIQDFMEISNAAYYQALALDDEATLDQQIQSVIEREPGLEEESAAPIDPDRLDLPF